MTTTNESEERAVLLIRLRAVAGAAADRYGDASLSELRQTVDGCEAQRKFYADCGFEDMSAPAK